MDQLRYLDDKEFSFGLDSLVDNENCAINMEEKEEDGNIGVGYAATAINKNKGIQGCAEKVEKAGIQISLNDNGHPRSVQEMEEIEEKEKEEEEEAKKEQSVDINKDVLKEMINATAADAQQQVRAIALDKQQQLCKVSEALAVLASASSINLYGSMMHKQGTDGGQDIMKAYKIADEEINDSSDEHMYIILLLTNDVYEDACIYRATLSSLPDEVVGITSLPSEDSVSKRQEELTKSSSLALNTLRWQYAEEVEKGIKINGHPHSVVQEIEEILLPPKKKFGRPKKVRSSPPKEKNPSGGPRKRNIFFERLVSC
nr:mitochondrial proton/calcium exchanger protein-like [Tanacetum cinerariifolium]